MTDFHALMLCVLQNLWRRILVSTGGATIPYPGPAKAEVVAFPAERLKAKPRPKPALKAVRSEKRVAVERWRA